MAVFAKQVAVVTGASSGIGKAIAIDLATEGAIVCLVGRDRKALDATFKIIGKKKTSSLAIQADLTNDEDIFKLKSSIQKHYGHVDILVHSAGAISLGRIDSTLIANFDRQYQTNVRAPFLVTQALLASIISCKGQIVFINSSIWSNAREEVGSYAATKYALKGLADSLREEVNATGVRVLSLFPGKTATPMQHAIHQEGGESYNPENFIQPKDIAKVVTHSLKLPRNVELTDLFIRPMKK